MAVDKLVDSTQLDADLTSVAHAIRTKGGTSASLAFPTGFVSAVEAIPTGGVTWDDIASGIQPAGDVYLNSCTSIATYAMAEHRMASFKVFSNTVTNLDASAFRNSTRLQEAHFPNLSTVASTGYVFYGCTNLQIVDHGVCATVRNNMFNSATAFNTLILRKADAIATLASTATFSGTCFASGHSGGTIYIPKVLYDHLGDGTALDYKANTTWATLDGYGTVTWAQIEGSIYEIT